MSHPVTRAKNANQHPGQVILDMKQKHRTSDQKHQDDTRKESEKQEQQASQAQAVRWVIKALNKGAEAEQHLLTTHHRPRPRKAPLAQGQSGVQDGISFLRFIG